MPPDDPQQRRGPLPALDTLLIDRNRDGFPDDIIGVLAIPEDLDRDTWEAVLNLSARMGLGTSGFTPPIVAREPLMGRVSITVRPGDAGRLTALAMGEPVSDSPHTTEARRPDAIDLSDPWSVAGFLTDRNDDQAADDSAIHLLLPDEIPFEIGSALADFAARIGVECGALTLPIVGGAVPPGRAAIRVNVSDTGRARLSCQPDGSLTLAGPVDSLASAIRRIASMSPGFLPDIHGARGLDWLRRSIAGWTPEGRAAQLMQALVKTRPDRLTILEDAPERQDLASLVGEIYPGLTIDPPSPRETVVFDHQWTAEWEVNRLLQSLEQEILPALDPAHPVQLIAMMSEPPAIRRRVRGQISRRMLERGFNQGTIHVLDAFKPGLCWLQECVLSELEALSGIEQIEIQARSWDPDQHDGQLDLSIRWMQELFPVDEMLASKLGLPLGRITLKLADDSDPIYRVTARNGDGAPLLERTFSPLWRRIDYLSGMPGAGNVTVTTGGIIVEQVGEIRRARVLTDPEVFWRYMQGELAPVLRRFILGSTASKPVRNDQPFFDDLLIDVRLSASDHACGIRQERHSAAEALHEDIYFNILDFVDEIGLVSTGERPGAPGPVRPFVTVTPGRQPEARIRLSRRPAGIARLIAGGTVETIQPASRTLPERSDISAIEFANDKPMFEVAPSPELESLESFLRALANVSPPDVGDAVLRLSFGTEHLAIGIPQRELPSIPDTRSNAPVPARTIVSNAEIFPHLNRLAEHPSVTFVPAAEISWQGRPIPAVAVTSPQQAEIWSMRKLSHFKPTKLIVARHHANEVASTTAALQMIEALTGDSTGEAMLAGLNVIFLPLENPDGAALHDQLRQENPTWKHHPARYNATGYEFGADQGNPDSQYGEGRVRDLVWHACLPDIVVDNHGVPSHEWAQLFAGFGSPPRFGVSFWQVQALLYGILPALDDPVHRITAETVRDRVSAAVAADDELLNWNRIYTERYRTWGNQWLPDRFPLTLFNEMLFHMSTIDAESARGRRSYAVRFPKTTVLNWVTEVCDETVEGEELERTARAHLLTSIAVLELLREQTSRPDALVHTVPGGVQIRTARERPLRIE